MADDVILIEYKAKITDLENKLSQIEKDLRGVDSSAKRSMGVLDNESKKAAASVNKVDKEVLGLGNKLKDLSGRIPGVFAVQEVLSYGKAIQGAAVATNGASTAMKLLKVAIASTGIGALVVAIGSLVAYFTLTEAGGDRLAKIMRVLGGVMGDIIKPFVELGKFLADTVVSISEYVSSGENAIKTTDDYKKSTSELSQEIADLEDQISALTITVDINNSVLQTGIENNLRALRNRNITLTESLKLIEENGKAELQQLKNSNSITDKKLELERKNFILKVKSSDLLSAEELRTTKATLENESQIGDFKRWRLEQDVKNHEIAVVQIKEQTALFDKFVKHEIDAQTLLDNVSGEFTEEDLKRVAEVVLAREAAIRNQSNAEEKLKNFKDAALDKDLARIKAEKDANAKLAADRKKAAEDLKKEEDKRLNDFIAQYAQDAKDKADIDAAVRLEKENSKKAEIKSLEDSDKEYGDFVKNQADEQAAERAERDKKEIEEERKKQALKMQILSDAVAVAQSFANKEIQRSFEKKQAIINSEIAANQKQTDTQSANIDKLLEKGLISEEQAASRKEALAKKSAKKDYDLKKKAFETQKKADEETAAINMAVAIIKSLATYGFTPAGVIAAAAAAAEGAIEIGFISSRKYPAFKDGVVGFKGKGTGTSDENHVMISNDESVITAKGTRKHRGLLEAVNEDRVEKYLTTDYLKPILAKQQRVHDREKRLLEGALVQAIANGNDNSHMERLIKNNKTVNLGNAEQIGKAVAKEMKSGNNPRMK